ncbi:MAG: hypothetical protein M3253_02750 [Chloroflexota bacterium]|nr:hypothetical protein [Chloroflexota bacterium]
MSDTEPETPQEDPSTGRQAPATEDEGGAVSMISDIASTIVEAAGPVISAAARPVGRAASGARRMFHERSGARVRRVRRMARQPLANLWDLHPEARRAAIRELGLQTVPVENIAGTAVEGAPQRGGDFLPLRDRRGDDWRARWQRILRAVEGLVSLPPIELIKLGDEYWVVDGHNRVAAALYTGQVALDALVNELRLPGQSSDRGPVTLAPYLVGSRELRAAGTGRLTRTTSTPDSAPPADDAPVEPERTE